MPYHSRSKTAPGLFFVLCLLFCLALAPAAPAADATADVPAADAAAAAPDATTDVPAADAAAASPDAGNAAGSAASGGGMPGTIARDGSNMSQYVQDSWVVSDGCGM